MNKSEKMSTSAYLYSDITQKIIGAAIKVHTSLGNGFQEVIYQRAIAIEFKKGSVLFQRELEMPIYYNGEEIGTRRVEFFSGRQGDGGIEGSNNARGCALSSSDQLFRSLSAGSRLAAQSRIEEPGVSAHSEF